MAAPKKVVYFLGAGASFGAGAVATVEGGGAIAIPTQKTFWRTFLRFCSSHENRSTIEKFLFRYFLGYQKHPGRLKNHSRWKMLEEIDVEEVFTFLSERIQAPSTSLQIKKYAQKVWDALVREIGNVFGRFYPTKETRRIYADFCENHLRNKRDVVVSFNYDTIFERSLPKGMTYAYEGLAGQHGDVRLVKPHGSINWSEVAEKVEVHKKDLPAECMVVAPTHLKFVGNSGAAITGYLNQTKDVAKIWSAMESHMRTADAFVFIGYSFPVADLYFSSVLRSVLAVRDSRPRVVIVNPDALAIAERLQSRFSISDITRFFDIRTFVSSGRGTVVQG